MSIEVQREQRGDKERVSFRMMGDAAIAAEIAVANHVLNVIDATRDVAKMNLILTPETRQVLESALRDRQAMLADEVDRANAARSLSGSGAPRTPENDRP